MPARDPAHRVGPGGVAGGAHLGPRARARGRRAATSGPPTRGSDAGTVGCASGCPRDSAPVTGSTCTTREHAVGVDLDDVAGDVVEPLVGDDDALDRLGQRGRPGDRRVQVGGPRRPPRRRAAPGRGPARAAAVSSSPRPAPMSTTVSSPASRAIRASARANSARGVHRGAEVRGRAPPGGRSRRRRTAPRPRPASRWGAASAVAPAGMPSEVIAPGYGPRRRGVRRPVDSVTEPT